MIVNSSAVARRMPTDTVSGPPVGVLTIAASGAVWDRSVAPFIGDTSTGSSGTPGSIVNSKSAGAQLEAPFTSVTFTFQNHVPACVTVAGKVTAAAVPDTGCEASSTSESL